MGIRYYEVGGAVRDRLMRQLGVEVKTEDRDWVVVGATPQAMLAQGFIPVGEDFPVFLHPETHEEYALARTERKTAPGYHGFVFHASPDVTLEDDLYRRDLTINAMAYDAEAQRIVDPYGGSDDLRNKVLRHVSAAFQEDPVRILRAARFAARFGDFTIHPETIALMRAMVNNGEANHLVAERVWAEMSRALMEPHPERFVTTLVECGYWEKAYSEIPVPADVLAALSRSADANEPLEIRLCVLCSAVTDTKRCITLAKARRLPDSCASLLSLFLNQKERALNAKEADAYFELLEASDLLRRPERFLLFLRTLPYVDAAFQARPIQEAARRYASVDAGAVATACDIPKAIPVRIREARLAAIQKEPL